MGKLREPGLERDSSTDLDFLIQLKKTEIETLVACIRAKVGKTGK